jgi:DNA polymerase-1
VLALMGDASDNIPGVPGIGEKTAMKLIGQYGTLDNLLAHAGELTGRAKQTLESNREQALLSRRLATINCEAPCKVELDALKVQPPNEEKLKELLVEFEFNSIGRRIFGENFKARPGAGSPKSEAPKTKVQSPKPSGDAASGKGGEQLVLVAETEGAAEEAKAEPAATGANLKTIADVPHEYHLVDSPAKRAKLVQALQERDCFCLDTETTSLDPKEARLVGLAFSFAPHTGYYVPVPQDKAEARKMLEEFRGVLESDRIEKVGHNLKFDLSVLKWHGISVQGKLFDTMVAHSLIEPEMRHGMDYLSEAYLGYTPIPISKLIGDAKAGQASMADGEGGRILGRRRRCDLATPRRPRTVAQGEGAGAGVL